MHPNIFHGSEPNISQGSRKTLLCGFCAFGANHKAYPGAEVNVKSSLTSEGEIVNEYSPWHQSTPFDAVIPAVGFH